MSFTLARRTARMNPSAIREILKVTERPDIVSLAGGLPSADTFPAQAVREAANKVLTESPREALQYAASEGHGPLREWIAAHVGRTQGLRCDADQVLITTGSQQGLDLVAKLFIDEGAKVLVETPTYLGALQAFTPFEPAIVPMASDHEGPLPAAFDAAANLARMAYLLPNFQNPSGHVYSEARRVALVAAAQRHGVPLVEDNPYGELWYDEPPPLSLASRWGDGVIYLGSFSKVLAPGLRLGYLVAPKTLYPKLLQAKQASDLHTAIINQRLVYEVVKDGLVETHVPTIRTLYKARRDAMRDALTQHFSDLATWQVPRGGMFFWLTLKNPKLDTLALMARAVQAGVAYVPGATFYAQDPQHHTLRLSFVTVPPDTIRQAIATLAQVFREGASS